MDNKKLLDMPIEILLEISKYLCGTDLLTYSVVCKRTGVVAEDNIAKKKEIPMKIDPFTGPEFLKNARRPFNSLHLVDRYFLTEPQKMESVLCNLSKSNSSKFTKIILDVNEPFEEANMEALFNFVACNPEISKILLSSTLATPTVLEFAVQLRRALRDTEVEILKHSAKDIIKVRTDVQIINFFEKYPSVKKLRSGLVFDESTGVLSSKWSRMILGNVVLKDILFAPLRNLQYTPDLFFGNLNSVSLCFNDCDGEENRSDISMEVIQEQTTFIQKLYSSNIQSLKSLEIEICNVPQIHCLLPSENINLKLEHVSLNMKTNEGVNEEDTIEFVSLFVINQKMNLKSVRLEFLRIDVRLIDLLSNIENLREIFLIKCIIDFGTKSPNFSNLITIDLQESQIKCCSLGGFFASGGISKTLQSFSLEGTVVTEKMDYLTSPFIFQELRKLNLHRCYITIANLSKLHFPALQILTYDCLPFQCNVRPVLLYPQLKVLGEIATNFYGVLTILDQCKKLEAIKIRAQSTSLSRIIKHFLECTSNIKLVKISCFNFIKVMKFLECEFKNLYQQYPGCSFECGEKESYIILKNHSITIVIQNCYVKIPFYENLFDKFVL